MAINKLVELAWDGKPYKVKITMAVIDKLDDEVNLAQMAIQNAAGDVRFTKVAKLFTVLLNEAGADVEYDDVFHALFGSGKIVQKEVQPMVAAIFTAIFPDTKKKSTTRPPAKGKSDGTAKS